MKFRSEPDWKIVTFLIVPILGLFLSSLLLVFGMTTYQKPLVLLLMKFLSKDILQYQLDLDIHIQKMIQDLSSNLAMTLTSITTGLT